MSAPVLVTGGTGFVGRALVRELSEQGRRVHVLCREGSDRSGLEGLDVTWHTGDLTLPASVHAAAEATAAEATAGAAANGAPGAPGGAELVHAAAVISYRSRDRALQRAVNVEGTRTVLSAARRFGFGRAVHVSSVVTVGVARGGETLDEDAAFNAGHLGVDYVDTKREAEEVALGANGDLEVVVVNPAAVFGAAQRESNTARFLRSIQRDAAPPLAPPGGLSLVGVEDTARGIRLALERGTPGRRYILAESYLPAVEVFRKAARAFGVTPVRGVVPRPLWPAVVAGARVLERVGDVRLATAQALRMLGLELRFSGARARAELGWTPVSFDRVLWSAVEQLRG